MQVGYLAYGLLAVLGTFLSTGNLPLPAFEALQMLLVGFRVDYDLAIGSDSQVLYSEVNAHHVVFVIGNINIFMERW